MANPNPTGGWKKGQSGNPGGKTSKQRKMEVQNAERATRIRAKMLKELEDAINSEDMGALQAIKTDILKLLKDVEDRGLGRPDQAVDVTTGGETMNKPQKIELIGRLGVDDDS